MNAATVRALRESGQVRRMHCHPHHGTYTVAEHCFNMACMAMALHPGPELRKLAVIEHILTHDFTERWVGDLPAPVKWRFPEVKDAMMAAERATEGALGVSPRPLSSADHGWVKALDIGELLLWALDQLQLGNRNVEQLEATCRNWIETRRADLPPEFVAWWVELSCFAKPDRNLRGTDLPWRTSRAV